MLLALAAAPSPNGFTRSAAPAQASPVKLTLTITDKHGRYVAALTRDRITVLEDGTARELASFEQRAEPASVGLVFDMSARDRPRLLASAKVALSNFVRAGGNAHRYFIIGFDRDVYLAADWLGSADELAAGFDRLAAVRPSSGKAALYDAVGAALLKAGEGPHPKRAIILISDGRNDGSKLKREELFEAARRSDALIYALAVKPPGDGLNLPDPSDHATLGQLCSTSGGFASSVHSGAEFLEFFERLSLELQYQYSVSFVPGDAGPGGAWRRLSFRAKPLELKKTPSSKDSERVQLTVRGREGYYHQR